MSSEIAIDARWCLRPLGSTCERCAVVCPHQAITLNGAEQPHIDTDACVACGLCVGVCDAFVDTDILSLDILAHAKASAQRFNKVHLVCMEALPDDFFIPASNVLVLSCLAELSPELWTALLANEIPLVLACDTETCKNCAQTGPKGHALWHYALSKAQENTGKCATYEKEVPQFESIINDAKTTDASDRRELIVGIGSTIQDFSSGQRKSRTSTVLDDCLTLQERMHARSFASAPQNTSENELVLTSPHKTRVIPPKLELIKQAVQAMPSCAKHITLPVAELSISKCDCANMPCTEKCPTHALRKEFGKTTVCFDQKSCVGCGYCQSVCPNEAIELLTTTAEIFVQ